MTLYNLHTHTNYCDGKSSAAEMARTAYEKGFSALGFSSHGYTPFDVSWCMHSDKLNSYINEISELKREYKGRMDIYLGLERDLYSEIDGFKYDFVIGGVHYVNFDGKMLAVDESADIFSDIVKRYFGGDAMGFVKAYYREVSKLASRDDIDIVAHFDLITKFNSINPMFDESSAEYQKAALCALDAFCGTDKIFEINSGAFIRGLRSQMYPADFLLKEINKRGFGIVISGDCHSSSELGAYFNEAVDFAAACGFKYINVPTANGFEKQRI